MPVPSTIDDLSTTASSNSPAGTDSPQDGDNYIRALSSFIAQLRDKLDGDAGSVTLVSPTITGTATVAAMSVTGMLTAEDLTVNSTATVSVLNVLADLTVDDDLLVAGDSSFLGKTAIGNAESDTCTVVGRLDGLADGGAYTPSASNTTNVTTITPGEAVFVRINDAVQMTGSFTLKPASTLAFTSFRLTVPVSSNFSGTYNACGVARRTTEPQTLPDLGAHVLSVSGAGNLVVGFTNDSDTTSRVWTYCVGWKVI